MKPDLPLHHPTPNRWVHLDVLRGIAILMVLGRHAPFAIPSTAFGAKFYSAWQRVGWAGVDLFFVLSGFLIGGLLFAEHRKYGEIRFGRFFIRRFFKIWPTYLVFLAVGFIWDITDPEASAGVVTLFAKIHQSATRTWPFLVQIQNYKETEIHWVIGVAWSLAIEEHFYLLLPLLLFMLARRRINNPYRPIPLIAAGLAMACLALRIRARHVHPEWNEFLHHLPTHLRIDSLFAGVCLAYFVHFNRPQLESFRRFRWSLLIFGIACFAPYAIDSPLTDYTARQTSTVGYTVLMIGSMALVLAAWFASENAATPSRAPNPLIAAMAMIGARSYSIYLFHVPLAEPLFKHLRSAAGFSQSTLMLAIYISLAIAIGALAYFLIEAPSVAMRDWLFPARSRPLVSAGSLPSTVATKIDSDPLGV